MRTVVGRVLFWLLAPAFEEYRRRYNTLIVRKDGSLLYPGAASKKR